MACSAPLASDQRYCVECGRRLGRARLPFMEDPTRQAAAAVSAPARRAHMSASTTLVAGVGTLLLAMGIGVLIGRSAPSSKAAGPVQVLAAPATSAAGTTGTAGTASGAEAASAAATSTTAAASSAGAKAPAKPTKAKPLPAKVVKVGSPGKGPGYEKGHFTGNFFGKGEE